MEAGVIAAWTFMNEVPVPDDVQGLLVDGEQGVAAFKTFRDSAVFTTKRLIVRDAQGLTGKKVEVYSLPYSAINMWSSENAGKIFDLSAEIELWTRAGHIKIKLGKGADVRRIDQLIAWAVLKWADPSPVRDNAENVPVSIDDRPHRTQIVAGWAGRAWAWLADATDGITWLIGLSVFFAGFGLVFFPIDLHDRNQARALQEQGHWVTAQEVQVRVDHVSGKGGGYSEVDGVRVRLDGSRDQVELENVNAESDSIWEDVAAGWQDPTSLTGYEPPLAVRVMRNSEGAIDTAMAKSDFEYWTEDNSDLEFDVTLGVGGLGAIATLLIVNNLRLSWQTKRGRAHRAQHEVEHRARVAATGKRSSR